LIHMCEKYICDNSKADASTDFWMIYFFRAYNATNFYLYLV
jgi:hypothetical protein